jgi:outer membrane immunogenic protein
MAAGNRRPFAGVGLRAAGAAIAAIIACPAIAKDKPASLYTAPVLSPVASWTGFYVGVNGGYGWGSRTANLNPDDLNATFAILPGAAGTPPPMAPFDMHGALGGLQGGYNWQFNRNWLVGIEADYDWAHIRGTGTSSFILATLPSTFRVTQNITSFGSVRARVGWVALPSLLVYGTGGFAYGRIGETEAVVGGGSQATVIPADHAFACGIGLPCFNGTSSRGLIGWTVGTGLEYALWEHWTQPRQRQRGRYACGIAWRLRWFVSPEFLYLGQQPGRFSHDPCRAELEILTTPFLDSPLLALNGRVEASAIRSAI